MSEHEAETLDPDLTLCPNPVGRASLPAYLEPQFSRYYRDLPHWRLTGSTYFVTWRLADGQKDLVDSEKDLIANAVKHFDEQRYDLFAWVVMNDHVHALVKPVEGQALERILHSWKSFTARSLQREFGRVGSVWQQESFDRIVRNESEFWQKFDYILQNPSDRWPGLTAYRWLGIKNPE